MRESTYEKRKRNENPEKVTLDSYASQPHASVIHFSTVLKFLLRSRPSYRRIYDDMWAPTLVELLKYSHNIYMFVSNHEK